MSKIIKIALILIGSISFSVLATEDSCENLYQSEKYEAAFEVCTIDANNGNTGSQNILGMLYDLGLSGVQDYAKAKAWYELAAARGDANAQYNLAYMYMDGLGGDIDYAKAKALYELAAAQGDSEALLNLGYMYQMGLGVSIDYAKAVELYKNSCDKGQRDGCDAYKILLNQ